MMTDRPGGFSTDDLGHIYEIMPALSRLIEMHYVRRTAVTLLDTYLGKQTGQKVLNGQVRRGDGDNIYSVIWFCDLRNSTALSETMAREDFLVMLNQFLEAMVDAVLDVGGEVAECFGPVQPYLLLKRDQVRDRTVCFMRPTGKPRHAPDRTAVGADPNG